jgi:AraC-like DNA-binding protein/mannose-6-phosphate isomerase-like protein (cupin superfamily)
VTDLYRNDKFLESKDFLFHAAPYQIESNETIPPHTHEFVELAFISQGEGEHEYEGVLFPISQGDVFIIEPGKEHAYRVGENQQLKVVNVLFVPALLTGELEALSNVTSFIDFFYMEPFLRSDVSFQCKLTLNARQQFELRELMDRLIHEYKFKESGYRFLIKTILIEIFITLSRIYEKNKQKPLSSIASDKEMIERVCQFIELRHASPLTLEQVSLMAGMSQSKFTSLFRGVVGKTFLEYRNEMRIRFAKRLLETTDDKIIHVAKEIGFDDLSHFNRLFKQVVGVSPGKYRQKAGTEHSTSDRLK